MSELCQHRKWDYKSVNEKAARRRLFNSTMMIVDQAAINAGFAFPRYAMKPMPAKPINIIAQVDGSGTAGTSAAVMVKEPAVYPPDA
jgi:hypothetical protein